MRSVLWRSSYWVSYSCLDSAVEAGLTWSCLAWNIPVSHTSRLYSAQAWSTPTWETIIVSTECGLLRHIWPYLYHSTRCSVLGDQVINWSITNTWITSACSTWDEFEMTPSVSVNFISLVTSLCWSLGGEPQTSPTEVLDLGISCSRWHTNGMLNFNQSNYMRRQC